MIWTLILVNVDAAVIGPFVSAYLLAIGLYIVFKVVRPLWPREVRDWVVPLVGFGGGVLDATGGGGWGLLVTGSLIGRDHLPRTVIESANLSEFLVTAAVSATYILSLGWSDLNAALGLVIEGVAAALLGGFIVSRIPNRHLMVLVGLLIVATTVARSL